MRQREIQANHLAQIFALELEFFDYASYQTDENDNPIRGLGRRTSKPGKTIEDFDQAHRQIWANCDVELKARKEDLKAKTKLTEQEQGELIELTLSFPDPILNPEPSLKQRIAELETRLAALEAKRTE